MRKKVLITGITGFAGSHLADYLISQKNYDVFGTYLNDKSLQNVDEIKHAIDLARVDLTNEQHVFDLVKNTKPEFVFHLAALSSPGDSFNNPKETITNNVVAQINLLEAIRSRASNNPRILIISSADVYGNVLPSDLPIDEDTSFAPDNPYAVSKLTQDFLGLQYFLSYKLEIVRARPFNHIGPRQSPNFVIATFAKKIAEIEKGVEKAVLHVGNLKTKRDFTDVRDMVVAYLAVLEKGKVGDVYNIGSGVSHSIKHVLHTMLSFAKVPIKIEVDKSLFRPSETENRLCDVTKFQKVTSWKPTMPLEKSLRDTLDYWRNIV